MPNVVRFHLPLYHERGSRLSASISILGQSDFLIIRRCFSDKRPEGNGVFSHGFSVNACESKSSINVRYGQKSEKVFARRLHFEQT